MDKKVSKLPKHHPCTQHLRPLPDTTASRLEATAVFLDQCACARHRAMFTLALAHARRSTAMSLSFSRHSCRSFWPSTACNLNVKELFLFFTLSVRNDYKLPELNLFCATLAWPAVSKIDNGSDDPLLHGLRKRLSFGHNLSRRATVYLTCPPLDQSKAIKRYQYRATTCCP